MSILVSHSYINTNFQVLPNATPTEPTHTGKTADINWITTNYYAYVTGISTSNRCPGSDQIFAIPNITTISATVINTTTVNVSGNVSNTIGTVTEVGTFLATNPNPTQYETIIPQFYSVNITAGYSWGSNLSYTFTPGTLYYLRAYVLYNGVYYYGSNVVTANTELPTLTMYNAQIFNPLEVALYFTCAANLDSSGGTTVTERGFVYATHTNPTISDTKLIISGTALGVYNGNGYVDASTTYYFRAYAINGAGVAYSTYSNNFTSGPFYINFSVDVLVTCTTGTTSVNDTRTLSIGSGTFSFGNDYVGTGWKTLQIYSFTSDYDGDGNALFTLKQGGVPISSYPVNINVNGVPDGGNIGLTLSYNDPTALCCSKTSSNAEACMIYSRISDQTPINGAFKENYVQYYANPGSGAGYYNCGYGCQYYAYNPGCSTCTPATTTTTTTTAAPRYSYTVDVYVCNTCTLIDSNLLVEDTRNDISIHRHYSDGNTGYVYRVIDVGGTGGQPSSMTGSGDLYCYNVLCI